MITMERDPLDQAARRELQGLFALERLHHRRPGAFVYLARDLEDDQQVAVKVVARAPDQGPAAEEAFHQAAAAAASLDHRHIVPVYSAGASDQLFWYSSEFIPAPSVAAVLERDGPMELTACVRMVGQVAHALGYAHRVGVVHADLKPANVLVDAAGDAHVTDFWVPWVLAQRHSLALPAPSPRRGVVRHRSLRLRGGPGPAADQYALAALAYECLGGSPPQPAPAMALVGRQAPDAIPPLSATRPDVPAHVSRAVERALRPSPDARFASVLDFAGALEAPQLGLVETRSASASLPFMTVDTEWEPPASPTRRKRWVLGGLLGLAAVGTALGVWLLSPDSAAREPRPSQSPPGAAALLPSDSALQASTAAPRSDTAPRPLAAPAGPAASRSRPVPALSSSFAPAPSRATPPARPAAPRAVVSAAPRATPPPKPAAPRAAASAGWLFVNSTPWGQVYVDDVPVGNTPRADLAVAPGVHRVRVVRDGFQSYEVTIPVASGEVVRLTDIVLKELAP